MTEGGREVSGKNTKNLLTSYVNDPKDGVLDLNQRVNYTVLLFANVN